MVPSASPVHTARQLLTLRAAFVVLTQQKLESPSKRLVIEIQRGENPRCCQGVISMKLVRDDLLRPSVNLIRDDHTKLLQKATKRGRNKQARFNGINKSRGIIYIITNKMTGHRYVGATTKTIGQRFKVHRKSPAKRESSLTSHLQKHGVLNFKIQHVATAIEPEYLAELEAIVIKQEKPEYNTIQEPQTHYKWKGFTKKKPFKFDTSVLFDC